MKKIEFSCSDENILKYFPPLPAKKNIPDWYKSMSRYINDNKHPPNAKERVLQNNLEHENYLTIKGCVPVQDYLTSGYIIQAPFDILISPDVTDTNISTFFWWSKHSPSVSSHGHVQCPIEIKGKENIYIKFMNPWTIKTPPGYSCFFYQPEFFFEDRFELFPAIVDTDKHVAPVNFPGVVTSNENFKIEAGTPLMAVFPFKRESWESEINLKKDSKYPDNFIEKVYSKLFHSPKSYE